MPRFEPHPARRPAVVTGASSGIGAAAAAALAKAGHPVALGARRADKCEELAAAIRADGGEAVAFALDVTDDESVKSFAAAAEEALGPAEVLVLSIGVTDGKLVYELDSGEFGRMVEVNLTGAHRLVSAIVPGMVWRRRGDVVVISSDVVPRPRPRMGGYIAAKHGLDGMAQAMQMELEGTGVRVCLIRPGQTLTEMGMSMDAPTTEAVLNDWIKWGVARHPHFLRPKDVAAVVTTVVSTPRGTALTLVEIQPEAPVKE
jgi:NADP-dependent 3-hydroxy acid dehydrogenase YdfG